MCHNAVQVMISAISATEKANNNESYWVILGFNKGRST